MPKETMTGEIGVEFRGRVLIIGFGSVAKCTLPILLKHIRIPCGNITIIDIEDKSQELAGWAAQGIRFVQRKVTPETLDQILSEYLEPGSLGDLPLIVLTAPNKTRADDFPVELNDKFNQIWFDLHLELVELSSNSTHIVIEDSDHFIHHDRPEVVIEVILAMIEEVRN